MSDKEKDIPRVMETADFMTLLKRAHDIHNLVNKAFPGEDQLNLISLMFCHLLFSSGHTGLGNILHNVGNLHDAIMMARGTGELVEMLAKLKKEGEKKSD